MTCAVPMKAWKVKGGGLTFRADAADDPHALELPCGQCMSCRLDRAHEWTTRLAHEQQMTEAAQRPSCFITLTYRPEALPRDLGLHVSEWQDFAKRLRHRKGPFRFYMIGEYGEKELRPHFHAIVYGITFMDRVVAADNGKFGKQWWSAELERTWGKGGVRFGDVNVASIRYVAQYGLKKLNGERGKLKYRRCDGEREWQVRPEFSTMSRNPGIGAGWYEKFAGDIHPRDQPRLEGRRVRTPRYYDGLWERAHGKTALDELKEARRERAEKNADALAPARRKAKEEILKIRARARKM